MHSEPQRYQGAAILLHWAMALAFLLMLASGLAMVNLKLEPAFQFQLYQWHKSLGVVLLLLVALRILLRLRAKIPALPETLPAWEKRAAKLGHLALYVWMLALPLAGWVMVSASPYGLPTIVFNQFEWPHLPNLAGNEAVEQVAKWTHRLLAYSFIALIAVHVGAVIKHAWRDGINLLPRMGIGKAK
jgi:cytochrome b561